MRIIPPLRDRVGDALVQIKEANADLKWMDDTAFVSLAVQALEERLARQKRSPIKEAL